MIGAKITYYRTLRDMSQKELAKRANKMSVNEESSYTTLANNIYKFRALNNLSQKDLAEKSNVSAAYISQIENCRPNKGIASIVKIAQVLNVPPCILFAEESCPKYLLCLERAVSLSNRD